MKKLKSLEKVIISLIVVSLISAIMVQMASATDIPTWQSDKVYWGGDEVQYNGDVYKAKWWTKGDRPDKKVANTWDTPWELKSGNTDPTNPVDPTDPVDPTEPDNPPSDSKVIYPDYSSVDVGKGIVWPKSVFAPFVDATGWPPFPLAEKTKELKVPYYNLGFIVSQSADVCKPTWGTYYSAEKGPLNDEIKKVRQMGGDVIVSFGGAANVPLHAAAPDAESLKEQYKRFVKAYGLTRIDFDIEGAWVNDTVSLKRNSKALKMLQDELKAENYNLEVWFTLPVLPTGLTQDGINVINLALDAGVEIAGINVMTMDYGDATAPNPQNRMAEYGIDAIKGLHSQLKSVYNNHNISKSDSQLWSMVGTTPMIGMNDVTTEIFNQQDARETLKFAQDNKIGMISMWSINRDKSPSGKLNYVSITESSIVQKDYEFSTIFNGFNTGKIIEVPDEPNPTNPTDPEDNPETPSDDTWSSNKVYVGGDRVTYKGHVYEAKWWSQGNDPSQKVNFQWETPWKLIK